jgi:hypothetical protein
MNSNLPPGVVLALLVVFAIIAVSYFVARKQQSGSRPRNRPPNAGAYLSRGRLRELTAQGIKVEAQRLHKAGAQWPEVLTALNPQCDNQTTILLQALRGPHMFNPGVALSVILHGCDVAIRKSSTASALVALQEANESMEKVTRFGD